MKKTDTKNEIKDLEYVDPYLLEGPGTQIRDLFALFPVPRGATFLTLRESFHNLQSSSAKAEKNVSHVGDNTYLRAIVLLIVLNTNCSSSNSTFAPVR